MDKMQFDCQPDSRKHFENRPAVDNQLTWSDYLLIGFIDGIGKNYLNDQYGRTIPVFPI